MSVAGRNDESGRGEGTRGGNGKGREGETGRGRVKAREGLTDLQDREIGSSIPAEQAQPGIKVAPHGP